MIMNKKNMYFVLTIIFMQYSRSEGNDDTCGLDVYSLADGLLFLFTGKARLNGNDTALCFQDVIYRFYSVL